MIIFCPWTGGGLSVDAEDEAHKKYNRDLRATKPDLLGYERQKEAALGLAPGTLVPAGATSETLAVAGPSRVSQGLTAHEDLYRGMDTLAYGDSKPSEDAVDRVVGKINKECVLITALCALCGWCTDKQPQQEQAQEEGRRGRGCHVYQRAQQGVQQEDCAVLRQVYQRVGSSFFPLKKQY